MKNPKFLISIFFILPFLQMGDLPAQSAQELIEMQNQIRIDKFDQILPGVMREHKIDMWIQVMRSGNYDPLATDMGSNSGVFIFTDNGGERIERAVFDYSEEGLAECGAYDLVTRPESRMPLRVYYATYGSENPGNEKTELDYRFRGVGEYVSERDPQRIAINYLEDIGSPVEFEIPMLRFDGISLTDYFLLTKELGEKYSGRIVSAEYLITDYLARPVKSEIEYYKIIRKDIKETIDAGFNSIVPGETRWGDMPNARSLVDKDGKRGRQDHIIQGGDLICLAAGLQSGYLERGWRYGNFCEVSFEYGYVLKEGETELPPRYKQAWDDVLKVRKILDANIIPGRTAGETFEILKQKIEEAGYIYINTQDFDPDQDMSKSQVPLDMHAAGKGIYAPRLGPLGPDWQRDMVLPMYHHFYNEYWVYQPMPEWGEGRYMSIQLHDGAIATENGVEYFAPHPSEIRLIK